MEDDVAGEHGESRMVYDEKKVGKLNWSLLFCEGAFAKTESTEMYTEPK